MTIKVYWACFEDEWIRAEEPESVLKRLFKNKPPDINNQPNNTSRCPAIGNALKNMFALKSLYSYDFNTRNGTISSESHDQKFFNRHVTIRDYNQKFFSFSNYYIFFTEEESLEITAYLSPFAEENEVSRRTWSIPGSFDIGKWFRPIEFNFYLRDEFDEFSIMEGDVYTYIKFNTDEKIVFQQFIPDEEISKYIDYSLAAQSYTKTGLRSLKDYYKMLTFKKRIISSIKKNLI